MDNVLRAEGTSPGGVEGHRAKFQRFLERLDVSLQPHLGKIAYGNLRRDIADGHEAVDGTSNIAIVYETPGGSTDQINIVYDNTKGSFHLITEDEEVTLDDPDRVLQVVDADIAAIPQKRMATLREQADHWLSQGRSRGQMFAELNRILQSGLRGGSITATEMRDVCRYIVEKHGGNSGEAL